MITADKLTLFTTLGPTMLSSILDASGYKNCKFKTAKFLGMTNGGQFCYTVTYHDDADPEMGKVFVTYDQANDRILADY